MRLIIILFCSVVKGQFNIYLQTHYCITTSSLTDILLASHTINGIIINIKWFEIILLKLKEHNQAKIIIFILAP